MMKKNPQSSVFSSRSRGAFEIALFYLLIGILWIVFSDEAAAKLAPNQAMLTQISIYKGWGYVFVTALALYWIISFYMKRLSRAEGTLSASEKNYEEFLQQASDGIFIADAQGNYTLVNEEACKLVGYTQAELLSMNLRELIAPEDIQITPPRLDELRNGKTLLTERKLLRKDGSRILCEISAKQLKDGRFQSIIRDITERKVTDDALLRSERRYRSLFENMTNGFARCQMLYDENGNATDFIYLDTNGAFEKLTGLSNVIGKRVSTVIPGIRESNPELFEIYGRVALTGKPEKFETYVPGLGEGIWFSVSAYSTEKGFFVAVFETITERKQVELDLQDVLVNLESAEEQAGLGSWYFDTNTHKGWWSKQMYRLFELDPSQGMPSNEDYLKLIHPEDRELLSKTLMQMGQGIAPEKINFRINPKPGITRTLSPYYHVEKDQTGRVIKFSGTVLDITEHKQIEEELKASELRFRLAAESLTDVIYEWDLKEKVDWFGDVDGLMGYAPGAFPRTLTGWAALLHPEDQARVLAAVDAQLKGGAAYNLEYRVATKNGEWRWWSARGVALRDPQGIPYQWIGSISDITIQKRQVEALKESEKKYRTLHESMIDGFVSVDMQGNFLECNEVYKNMLGYSDAELAGLTYVDITPESWHAYETEVVENQILKRGFSDVYEKEYRRKDGTIFPVELHTVLLRDEAGIPSGMWAIVRDITERKQAEAELRHSEEQYRLMFANNPQPMFVFDRETFAFLAVNDATVAQYGYSRAEFLQMTIKDIRPSEDISASLKIVATKSEPYFKVGIVRHRKKDGTLIDVEITRHDILFDGHEALIILANDVTEQNRVEEALRQSEQKYTLLFEKSAVPTVVLKLPEVVIFDANEACEKLTGFTRGEMFGKTSVQLGMFGTERRKELISRFESQGELTGNEVRLFAKNGKEHIVLTNTTPLTIDGQMYAISTMQDITERKQAEAALHEREQKLNTILNLLPVGVSILGEDRQVVYSNDTLGKILGTTRDGLLKGDYHNRKYLNADGSEKSIEEFASTRAFSEHTELHNIVTGVVKEDGQIIWTSVSAAPVDFPDWKVVLVTADITERTHAELALQAAEYKYRTLAENSPDIIYIIDLKTFKTIYLNRSTILGYTLQELEASGSIMSKVHPDDIADLQLHWRSVMNGTSTEAVEYRLQLKDGSWEWLSSRENFLGKNENGIPAQILVTLSVITERKQAEAELRQSQENFAKAFTSNPAALAITRLTDGKFININPAYTRIMQYGSHEILGRTAAEMNIYVRPEERDQLVRQLREQGTIQNYELHVRTKSGETRSIVISMEPLFYNGEECILSVFIDISERKKMELELQRSNVELEQFAYVASHDLQEPLRAVAGMVQLLQQRYQGKLDERADEYIGHAVDAATRMQSLINDLLEYSRVNRWGKAFESMDLEKALNNALANLHIAIHESNAQITHDPLPTLMADAGQLTQLLQNLMGNAIKFRGVRPLHIHIGAKKIERAWQFEVSDNGIGIESKYYERIFLVFQRLHTRREYPGTGIGLALCKKIIERHGGQIWVESQPGQGSTFYFTIPER